MLSYRASRGFLSLAILLHITAPAFVSAEDSVCARNEVVLQLKHGKNTRSKLDSLNAVAAVKESDSSYVLARHRNASGEILSRHETACASEIKSCVKLLRNARARGASHLIRAKQYACSVNYKVHASVEPDDKYFTPRFMWGFKSKYPDIHMPRAWNFTTGSSDVAVAVIDTGIDYTHPDLVSNVDVSLSRSFIDGQDDPMDQNGHGTHVAGTIGASGNNGIGVVGINWRLKIIALRFLDASGSGYLSDAIEAINYARDLKSQGVNLIATNNSWGGGGYSGAMAQAIASLRDAGVLFVAAAGNEANNNDAYPSYPANYGVSNIISVGAMDKRDGLAYFSNYGRRTVDIAAPGVSILSTYVGGAYAYLSGTSMAAPHVTGVAALVKATDPTLTSADIKERILTSAFPEDSLSGYIANSGFLNAYRAVRGAYMSAHGRTKYDL